jgi:hypothetical protein
MSFSRVRRRLHVRVRALHAADLLRCAAAVEAADLLGDLAGNSLAVTAQDDVNLGPLDV